MEKEISLQELFKVLWKGKFVILLTLFSVLIVTFIGIKIYSTKKSQVSTVVTLQWEGINDGQYPDGGAFNYKHLIDPYIIIETLEQVSLTKINNNDLRNAIVITPLIPDNIVATIEKAIKEGKNYDYYPTHYKITISNGALNISVSEAQSLLNEMIEQFRCRFNKKYVNQSQISNLININLDKLEFIDLYQIFISQLQLIESAVSIRLQESEYFVSDQLKIGFNDLLIKCNLLKDTTLNQISSRIDTYYLAKDEEYLISKYTYEISRLQLELMKAEAMEANIRLLIENYNGDTHTIILPGTDPTQIIEIDTYYNKLMDNLLNQQKMIIELESKINYYTKLIKRYKGEDPDYFVTPEERLLQTQKVETDILDAEAALEKLIADTNIILIEHNNVQVSEIIKPLSVPQYQSSLNVTLYGAVALLLGSGLGAAIVLLKHKWQ